MDPATLTAVSGALRDVSPTRVSVSPCRGGGSRSPGGREDVLLLGLCVPYHPVCVTYGLLLSRKVRCNFTTFRGGDLL